MDINKVSSFLDKNGRKTVDKLFEVAKLFKPSTEVFPIGISEFDTAMDGGFRGGELVIISGPTGMGKTLYAQVLTTNLNKVSIPNLWFTYEMSPWYLKEKFVKMGETSKSPIYSPVQLLDGTIKFIDQEIKEAIEEYACKVIFIDHLHYLIPLQNVGNSSLMIGGIVRELKKIAIKRDVIIVLIAHTKKIYQDEKLDLSSIRDSSLVSQESDYVFLVERLKREENTKKLDTKPVDTIWTNNTKIQLAKNRRTGKLFYVIFQYTNNTLIPISNSYDESNIPRQSSF